MGRTPYSRIFIIEYLRMMKQKMFLQKSNARLDIAAVSLNRNQQIDFAGSVREYFNSDSKL
jgi:hypothetical protein